MGKLERVLLERAIEKFGYVEPCVGRSLSDCFRRQNGTLQFWFNDQRGNTHLLYIDDKVVS
jgi:ribosome modulation factor